MNKKTKFVKLLSGEDHSIALFKPIVMHFAARFNGTTYGKFASDHKIFVESNIKCMEYFDFVSVSLISDPYRETSAFGARIKYLDEGVPQCLDKLVNSVEDARSLIVPDIYKCERTLDRIKGAAYFQKLLKETIPVGGWIEGPLAEACDLAGLSEMLVNLMCDPDFANYLMDKCMAVAKDFAKAQINEGCDYIGIGDAICSQIDAETYSMYVKDRHRELVNHIHSLGSKAKIHICGDINHLLPAISELNFDIIDLDWQVDLTKAREILGDNIVIKGNINPIFIQDETSEEISKLASSLIESQKGKKFILSGGCELSVFTPHKNVEAMRKVLP